MSAGGAVEVDEQDADEEAGRGGDELEGVEVGG